MENKCPEIRLYAGPNGSGKSTITVETNIIPPYINADNIQRERNITNMEAARLATQMRNDAVDARRSFTFETVLSTDRNLLLLERAKASGYFVRCSYVLTVDPKLNTMRVESRFRNGGHDVPKDKIISRYYKALGLIPRLILVCDCLNIYDNTLLEPVRIFQKRDDKYTVFENEVWAKDEILNLVTLGHK